MFGLFAIDDSKLSIGHHLFLRKLQLIYSCRWKSEIFAVHIPAFIGFKKRKLFKPCEASKSHAKCWKVGSKMIHQFPQAILSLQGYGESLIY